MASRLLVLLVLVTVFSGVWAALVTLFTPPLTLGWREFYQATVRRWVAYFGAFAAVAAAGFLLWLIFLALR